MADHVALIREAAQLIRQRARAATVGPWVTDASEIYSEVQGGPWVGETLHNDDPLVTAANAAHIASWHPGVALFVADLLEGAAHREEDYINALGHDHSQGEDVCGCDEPDRGDEAGLALAFARAYLGRSDG